MPIESVNDIDSVAVLGAGNMGRGIGAVTALAGYETALFDIDENQLSAARDHADWSYNKQIEHGAITETEAEEALDRFTTTLDQGDAVSGADLVIEAVPEKLELKEETFATAAEHAPEHAIFATNSSGLSVTRLAESTDRPEQFLGLHWFNPPMLMDLIELVYTEYTDPAVAEVSVAFAESVRKEPIECRRDIPKYIVGRLMRPFIDAPAWLVHQDEADIEEIDSAMKYREDFPMGPFELADYTNSIKIRAESEGDHLKDERPLAYETRHCPLVHDLYEQGCTGKDAGCGFYDYSESDDADISEQAGADFDTVRVWAPIINEAAKMVQHDVTSVEDVDKGARLGLNWPVGPFEKADEIGARRVVEACIDTASRHDRIENVAESLPCDLLVSNAKADESFY